MPFESKAQQRYMFAKHPKIAKRWAKHTPDMKALPEKKMEKKAELVESFSHKLQKEAFRKSIVGTGLGAAWNAGKSALGFGAKAARGAPKPTPKVPAPRAPTPKATAPRAPQPKAKPPVEQTPAAPPATTWRDTAKEMARDAAGYYLYDRFLGQGGGEDPSGGQDPSAANAMAAEAGRQSALYGTPGGNRNVTPEQDTRHSMERARQGAPLAMYKGTNVPKIPTSANLLPRR